MSVCKLPDDVVQHILQLAVRSCLETVETHAVTEYMFAFLSKEQYRLLAPTVLLTRGAVTDWLTLRANRTLYSASVVCEVAKRASSLGPEFETALDRLCREYTQFGTEYTTRTVRRLLASATSVAVDRNFTPMEDTGGTTLACVALYSLPLLVQLSRRGVTRVDDSSIFAPMHAKHVWLRARHFPAECLPAEDSRGGLSLSDLFTLCLLRWAEYQRAEPPTETDCVVKGCEDRGKSSVAVQCCTMNTAVS